MKHTRFLFIINPISGGKKNIRISATLPPLEQLDDSICEFRFTKYAGHGYEIAKKELNNFDAVIAVGGDGTVNEISRALIGSDTPLGIIPRGSGNGLGLFLDIPVDPARALEVILNGNTKTIDTGLMNNQPFVNVAGVGFDALISHRFADLPTRGLRTYASLIVKEYFRYKPQPFQITLGGKNYSDDLFLISFANSSQWGNNFHVAGNAIIDDGLLNLTVIDKIRPVDAVPMGIHLINGSLDRAHNSTSDTFETVTVRKPGEILAHLDGEPVTFKDEIEVKVVPNSLRVIVP